MQPTRFLLLAGTVAAAGSAAPPPPGAGTVTVTIPRLSVAEYHKPYVAVWLEPAGGGTPRTLAVWYDVKKNGARESGTKWLADMRSWWRKAGRTMTMPADGISGATRTPGSYTLPLPAGLAPGAYVLNVEAARENGGRELVTVPVRVPGAGGRASGRSELGVVAVAR